MNEYLNIDQKYLYYQQKSLQMENIKTYYSLIKSIYFQRYEGKESF